MGKKKSCPKCGKEFQDSRKEKAERFSIETLLKGIKLAEIDELKKETEDSCYCCWKARFRTVMKPYAQALGKTADDW